MKRHGLATLTLPAHASLLTGLLPPHHWRARQPGLLSPGGADEYWTLARAFATLGDVAAGREWAGRARVLFPGARRFAGGA